MSQRAAFHALLILVAAALWGSAAGGRQPDADRAAAVKAGMIVNFIRYTTWPESSFRGEQDPVVVTMVGGDGLGGALASAVRGQTKDGRRIEVRRVRHPEAAAGAAGPRPEDVAAFHRALRESHLVCFGDSERGRHAAALRALRGADVLTVGDLPGFAEDGGMLGFVLRDRRVAFEANVDVIQESALQVSSQVLRLAKIVKSRDEEGGRR